MSDLVDQQSANPTRKLTASALGGAFAVLFVWGVQTIAEVTVPPGIEGALTVVFSFLSGYIVRDARQPEQGAIKVTVENEPSEPVPTAPQQMVNVATPRFGPPTTSGDG